MRKVTIFISALLAVLLTGAVQGLTDETKTRDELLLPKKDACLLLAMNCNDNSYVIEKRIEQLRKEIDKGNLIYTNEELNILKKKLDDAYKALEFIFLEGA